VLALNARWHRSAPSIPVKAKSSPPTPSPPKPKSAGLDYRALLSDESESENSSSSSSEEEDADDGFDAHEKLPEFKKMAAARGGGVRRGSVSGESTQSMMEAAALAASAATTKPRKSDEQHARIDAAVKDNLLFSSFKGVQLVDGKWRTAAGEDRAEALEKLYQCMEEKVFGHGGEAKDIITQGDEGDFFYVIDSGVCEILINGQRVGTCGKGDSFGELALMYFAPRAATIRATERTVVWAMDRLSFQGLLQKSESERREEAKSMMVMCPLLEPLDEYERDQVVDALEEEVYADGMYILAEGDAGDAMYILQEGACEAVKKTMYGEAALTEYGPGDYFGELALLTKAPRKASVVARGEAKVVRLGRKPFQRLVGKCDEVLRRNRQLYAEVNEALAEMLGSEEEEEEEATTPAQARRERAAADDEAAIRKAQMGLSPPTNDHGFRSAPRTQPRIRSQTRSGWRWRLRRRSCWPGSKRGRRRGRPPTTWRRPRQTPRCVLVQAQHRYTRAGTSIHPPSSTTTGAICLRCCPAPRATAAHGAVQGRGQGPGRPAPASGGHRRRCGARVARAAAASHDTRSAPCAGQARGCQGRRARRTSRKRLAPGGPGTGTIELLAGSGGGRRGCRAGGAVGGGGGRTAGEWTRRAVRRGWA
jgi:cAMP-dependent protein kinase regulator